MDLSLHAYDNCELCPRRCGARRTDGMRGACGCSSRLLVARSALHFWEEPPISGENGSGTIFFSGCPLRCVFCQNSHISHDGFGIEVTVDRLSTMMLELQQQGALNINLVTPLHYAPQVCMAVSQARTWGLTLPIVCNTSGYERSELVDALDDMVDIWLTDFKYASPKLANKLSGARDYPAVATEALLRMLDSLRRKGGRLLDTTGCMQRGIIVRHLVLPGHAKDSCAVLDKLWSMAGNEIDLSIMNQYTPNDHCLEAGGPLSRTLDDDEYDLVLLHADALGFRHIWWQEGPTASQSFIPAFDATGVRGPEHL